MFVSMRLYLKLICLFLFVNTKNVSAGSIDNLANELVSLRGQVEALQNQLDLAKEEHRNRMMALNSQFTDLGVEVRRQQVSLKKMQQALLEFNQTQQSNNHDSEQLAPVLHHVIANLQTYVKQSLPFKTPDRLAVLTHLDDKLSRQLIDPKRASNRLWAFVEDEIRLSKENGLYRQTIELNGEKVLAEVAKLGSIFLYFKTSDGVVGMAKRETVQNQWQFLVLQSATAKEQIGLLFDSLKKQIRQGYFELPNPLES